MLPVTIVATALLALLAFAPFASAAPDPVASGSTTVTLNNGWTKYLKTFGIKIQKVSPAKLKGQKATFKVTGGEMDPTNGLGTLTLGGGLKFKAGKKSATVKGLVLNTGKSSLEGKIGGKKVKLAKTSGLSFSRAGFGVKVNLKKLQLTNAAATKLNKALGFAKGKPKPFLKNKLIGKSASEDQPSAVTLLPTGSLAISLDSALATKLTNVKTEVQVLTGTTASGTTYTSPVTGGTFSPLGTSGTIISAGGLKLVQKLPKSATEFITTEITLGGIWYDLQAKTLTVEVSATSNASKELNLGALGRSSVADVTIGGVIADPNTRSVAIQNSSAVLQPVSAEVLNGFVKVYAGYVAEVKKAEGKEAEGKELAAKIAKENEIASGNILGTVSFSGQSQ
ncbi:MAG: hypothetical protein JST31_07840 [Actinobacteria bacterium]|nr:hypothetical protein [Actinomycetota bacterium]